MGYIYGAIMLILLGGGGYGVWAYTSAIKENKELQSEAENGKEREAKLRETIKLMDDSLRDSSKLAAARASRAAKAEEEAGRFQRELEELQNADKPSRDWSVEPVPDGIRKLRKEGAFAPAIVPSPDGRPRPDPGSPKVGPN